MDGGVPILTEHYVARDNSAKGSFVAGVVEQLLSGSEGANVYLEHFCVALPRKISWCKG